MKINYLKIINNFVKNTQTSSVVGEGIDDLLKTASGGKNAIQKNITSNQKTLLNSNQDIKFNSINRMEQAALIKELLKLPGEMDELFSLLVYKKISPETSETLLKQNQKLSTDLIKELLENNSKESLNKLLKLFQQAPGGTQNTEQLKEVLSLLSRITPKKEASPQQLLTNLTLLYLPWLPLSEKQHIEILFEKLNRKEEEKEEENSEQTVLVIYITTINLGRFKVSIILNKDYSIKIEINYLETEKNEKKKEYLEKILKGINEQTRKDKIKARIEFTFCETGTNEINSLSQKNREVIISPTKDVSPVLIIAAQKIAKIILETDEKISLLQEREKMMLKD